MTKKEIRDIFYPRSTPFKLAEILADGKPRSPATLHKYFSYINLSISAQRANKRLKPHGYEIQCQKSDSGHWLWVLIGGRSV